MNPALYIFCFLPLIMILIQQGKRRRAVVRQHFNRKRGGGTALMLNPEQYIGKICTVITISDSNVKGKIVSIDDGWLTVDNGRVKNTLNLDYIVRIACVDKDNERS